MFYYMPYIYSTYICFQFKFTLQYLAVFLAVFTGLSVYLCIHATADILYIPTCLNLGNFVLIFQF
jgi:hypothetical protein